MVGSSPLSLPIMDNIQNLTLGLISTDPKFNHYDQHNPHDIHQPDLERLFSSCGNIITSRILCDNITGEHAIIVANINISMQCDNINDKNFTLYLLSSCTPWLCLFFLLLSNCLTVSFKFDFYLGS